MKGKILGSLDSPRELETLYRRDPAAFSRCFPEVFALHPESVILQVWKERLQHQEAEAPESMPESPGWDFREIALIVVLALAAGTLARLPQFVPWMDGWFFYSRYAACIVLLPLAVYFCVQNRSGPRLPVRMTVLFLIGALYLTCLPDDQRSDSTNLACLHLPVVLWSLLGISFLGGRWRDPAGRMDFIRFNGELIIYTTIILIGGMVLTGLTFGLFRLIDLKIEEWYINNVVVYGVVASPLVAALVISRFTGRRVKIATLLAKVFTPLFLATVIAYLAAMAVSGRSPYHDREFLIVFNVLLLVVLGLSVFSIAGRAPGGGLSAGDFMNMALVAATLVIDLVALSAILFRLTSHGFTPNRIAVLGANLLVFGNLLGIAWHYLRFCRGREPLSSLERWIASCLPAYTAWGLLVAAGFPLIFRFR